jgi:hypothetical protein
MTLVPSYPPSLGGNEGECLDRIVDVGVVRRRRPTWKGRAAWLDGPQQPLQGPNGIVVELFSFVRETRNHLGRALPTVMG